ncbi:DUF4826 family protein [Gammaproteobacteria bacterium AB-CW1]|uniref:DUF4826 family protein n=1 Tax=Natronospira elongata TaxID=3110268 RepID=A0AAP6JG43_9GAMM|nr:DUF4826 family protein [Gammaproteobacteria bacterium AB-CW1]
MPHDEMTPQQREQLTRWVESVCQDLARRLVQREILGKDTRVESRWVWPGRLVIGVAFEKSNPAQSKLWVVGGEQITPDFVALKVARNPREVARHLALDWQAKGARLASAGDAKEGEEQGQLDWGSMDQSLQEQAELMYALAEDDNMWPNLEDEPGAGSDRKD